MIPFIVIVAYYFALGWYFRKIVRPLTRTSRIHVDAGQAMPVIVTCPSLHGNFSVFIDTFSTSRGCLTQLAEGFDIYVEHT